MWQKADKAIADGDEAVSRHDLSAADSHYREAVELGHSLPGRFYAVKDSALKKLAEVRDAENKNDEAEALLKERLSILEQNAKADDLLIGLAMFDLQTHYGALQQVDKAEETAKRAAAFYKSCMAARDEQSKLCDRRLADVQGMMGFVFFVAKRSLDAEPWLRSVVVRDDDSVRPEIMLGSLQTYSRLLLDQGELAESAQFAHRAAEIRKAHPEAGRFLDGSPH